MKCWRIEPATGKRMTAPHELKTRHENVLTLPLCGTFDSCGPLNILSTNYSTMTPASSTGSTPHVTHSSGSTGNRQTGVPITHAPGPGPVRTQGILLWSNAKEPGIALGSQHVRFDDNSVKLLPALVRKDGPLQPGTPAIVHYTPNTVNPARVELTGHEKVPLTLDVRAYERQRHARFHSRV